jgi:hypothetical protein
MVMNAAAARRIVLHVGAPKSGTTFLQGAMWSQRDALLAQGFRLPGERERDMFHGAIEVRESFGTWGFRPEQLQGTWSRLCDEARGFAGTTIMSHELLGAATPEQVAAATAALEGEELHVVFTARDLTRQVTSEWQERIKNGSTRSFTTHCASIERQIREDSLTGKFWRSQDPVGVLGRWAAQLPPDRVHVVVCPPPGTAPEELWHRFGAACGFDARAIELAVASGSSNKTLGAVQASVLRRVNVALDGRIRQPHYASVVKRQFAQRALARQGSPSPACPAELVDLLMSFAAERNQELRSRGYFVHGDLAELLPAPERLESADDPDAVAVEAELDAAVAVIAEMLVDKAERAARSQPAKSGAPVATSRLGRRLLRKAHLGSPHD